MTSLLQSPGVEVCPQQHVLIPTLQRDPAEIRSTLASALDLLDYKHNARSAVILEYLTDVVATCTQGRLDCQHVNSLVSIAQQMLDMCAKHCIRDQVQQQLHDSLLQLRSTDVGQVLPESKHVPQLLPQSLGDIASCFSQGMLQHYNLYTLCLARQQQHVSHCHHLVVESAGVPPALELSLPEDDWQAHLAAEQAQREYEQAAAEASEQSRRHEVEAARIAQEQATQAAIRQEQLLRKPKTLEEAVDKLVSQRLEDVRQALADMYTLKQSAWAGRVAQLEQQTTFAAALAIDQSKGGPVGKEARAARTATYAGNGGA